MKYQTEFKIDQGNKYALHQGRNWNEVKYVKMLYIISDKEMAIEGQVKIIKE